MSHIVGHLFVGECKRSLEYQSMLSFLTDNKPNNVTMYDVRDNVADNSGVQYNIDDDDALNAYNIVCTC